jgi:predicted nucleic acid-binding Zn ribbon protein
MTGPFLDAGQLLKSVFKGSEFDFRLKEQTCIMLWDEIVGAKIAAAAQPEFIRDGVLFVQTKSAVWSNELTFYKKDIIGKLNKEIGSVILKDMVFKVGKISRKKKPETAFKQKPDLEGIELSDDELSKIDALSQGVGEDNRDAFNKLMITTLKLQKWKSSNGWTPCSSCGVLQHSASGVCPICKLPES